MKWGEELGEAKGKVQGESHTLTRILERRFGHLPETIRAKIASADASALDRWVDQVVDATSLDAIFGE